jgi:hypothetical protein
MSELLNEILDAHGGVGRWRAVTALTAHGRFGGLLRTRMPGNRMANVNVRVEMAEQRTVFYGFPQEDRHAVFDRGDVRLETRDGEVVHERRNPRAAFTGLSGLRRNFRWDALDAAYFAGYAWWNYLSSPLLLTRDGVTVTEGGMWAEAGEKWQRLEVSFRSDIHTHSQRQTLYVDDAGLIRRRDYIAYPIGRWAHAAHYCDDHQRFGGLVFPTRRRVRPQAPGGRSLPWPILVALDIDQIEVETETA